MIITHQTPLPESRTLRAPLRGQTSAEPTGGERERPDRTWPRTVTPAADSASYLARSLPRRSALSVTLHPIPPPKNIRLSSAPSSVHCRGSSLRQSTLAAHHHAVSGLVDRQSRLFPSFFTKRRETVSHFCELSELETFGNAPSRHSWAILPRYSSFWHLIEGISLYFDQTTRKSMQTLGLKPLKLIQSIL